MVNPLMCTVCQQSCEKDIFGDKKLVLCNEKGVQSELPVIITVCKKCGNMVIKKRGEISKK
jgi:hypothetical protein